MIKLRNEILVQKLFVVVAHVINRLELLRPSRSIRIRQRLWWLFGLLTRYVLCLFSFSVKLMQNHVRVFIVIDRVKICVTINSVVSFDLVRYFDVNPLSIVDRRACGGRADLTFFEGVDLN